MEGKDAKVIENSRARAPRIAGGVHRLGRRCRNRPPSARPSPSPENTFFAIKRLIGRRYDDPMTTKDKGPVPYQIVPATMATPGSNPTAEIFASQISAFILQKMKETAENYSARKVTQAVITVPRTSTIPAQATRMPARSPAWSAAHQSTSRRLPSSPTGREEGQRVIAVYDLGGGTFDISVLEIGDGVFEVKSTTATLPRRGGFDARIIDYLADEFRKEQGIDLRKDKLASSA